MIVPTHRMLWVFAAFAIPASFFAPALLLLFAIVAAADAIVGSRRASRVDVSTPAVVRFTRARSGTLPVTITTSRAVRVGLATPDEVACEQNEVTVSDACEVHLPCAPRGRGSYPLQIAAIGMRSPLGLWEARRRISLITEIRIYPDLLTGQESVAPLLLRRQAGLHVQRQVGRGREFEKLRDYLAGDPMSDIHWKATARRGHPVTRVYQIERTQEIYAIVDCSRLTAREDVLERYISAMLALMIASRQQGDLIGLATFSDSVHTFLRARSGPAHYDACRNTLLDVTPRRTTPDYAEVFASIESRLRRRALLVFLTELDDPVLAEDFEQGVRGLAKHHLVAVASVRPASAAPVFEHDVESVEDVYERLAGHYAWRRFEDVRKKLRAAGVQFSAVRGSLLGAEVARTYLNVKRRQIL